MRITESRLRKVIRSVLNEMVSEFDVRNFWKKYSAEHPNHINRLEHYESSLYHTLEECETEFYDHDQEEYGFSEYDRNQLLINLSSDLAYYSLICIHTGLLSPSIATRQDANDYERAGQSLLQDIRNNGLYNHSHSIKQEVEKIISSYKDKRYLKDLKTSFDS